MISRNWATTTFITWYPYGPGITRVLLRMPWVPRYQCYFGLCIQNFLKCLDTSLFPVQLFEYIDRSPLWKNWRNHFQTTLSWGHGVLFLGNMTFPSVNASGLRMDTGQEIVNFYQGIHLQPLNHLPLISFHYTTWVIPLKPAQLFDIWNIDSINYLHCSLQVSFFNFHFDVTIHCDNCVHLSFLLSVTTWLILFQDPLMPIVIKSPVF